LQNQAKNEAKYITEAIYNQTLIVGVINIFDTI